MEGTLSVEGIPLPEDHPFHGVYYAFVGWEC